MAQKIQDGFINLKDCSRPGQPKAVVTNANIATVPGLFKRDEKLTVTNTAHSNDISSGSTHKILTQQSKLRTFYARCVPIA